MSMALLGERYDRGERGHGERREHRVASIAAAGMHVFDAILSKLFCAIYIKKVLICMYKHVYDSEQDVDFIRGSSNQPVN